MRIGLILIAVLFFSTMAIILCDYFQHRKKNKCGYLVILRINNEYVRRILEGSGINLCLCAYNPHHNYLMCTEGDLVCGFREETGHIIADAKKNKVRIIDCGVSIKKFIYEVGVVKEIYKNER